VVRDVSLIQTSAGKGTRARPISLYGPTTMIPKGLMRVMGMPLAEIQLLQTRHFGVSQAYIIAKEMENREQLANKFGDGIKQYGISIKYSSPDLDDSNIGSGDAIITNIKNWNLNGNSLVLANDNIFEYKLDDLLRSHERSGAVITVLTTSETPKNVVGNYGFVDVAESGEIARLIEKPHTEQDIYDALKVQYANEVSINTGGYMINNDLLKTLSNSEEWIRNRSSQNSFDMAGDLITGLIKRGHKINSYSIDGWGDFGDLDKYLETTKKALNKDFLSINRILESHGYHTLDNNIVIHGDTLHHRIRTGEASLQEKIQSGSVYIGPNVFLGRDCIIEDDVKISYSDIEEGTMIKNGSEILNSIIYPHNIVGRDSYIEKSLIGLHSKIESDKRHPTRIVGSKVGPLITVPKGYDITDVKVWPGYRFPKDPSHIEGGKFMPTKDQLYEQFLGS